MITALTISHTAALIGIGVIAWIGLAICLAVAVGLTIREADRRAVQQRAADDKATALVVSGELVTSDVDELTARTKAAVQRHLRAHGLDTYL